MDDNRKTKYEARELKSIHLDCLGEYVQLVLEQCHINSLNLFNQVGLVAINMLGEVDESTTTRHEPMFNQLNSHPSLAEAADLIQDPIVVKWIRALMASKEKAIKNEDFALAKSLKILLDAVKTEGDVISKLEALKRKSIQSEDYDTAKNVKQEIEVKRRELQTIIQKQGFYYDSATNEMMLDASAAAHFAKPIVMAENSGNAAFEQLDSTVTAASAVLDEYHQKSPDNGKLKRATEAIEAPYPAVTARNETPAAEKNLPLEDRPIKPLKQSISLEEFDANSVPPGIETSATAANGDKAPAKPKPAAVKAKLQNVSEKPLAGATVRGKAAVEEKPAAPPAPENPLLFCPPPSISFEDTNPQFDEMNYRSTISLFESPFVNCLCSKDFQAREWAFNYADERLVKAKQLAGKSLADEAAFRKAVPKAQVDLIVRSMYEILYHGLEDSREKVTLRSLQLWRNLIDFCKFEQIGWPAVSKAVDKCVGVLIQKSVDSARYQKAAFEFIRMFVSLYGTPLHPLFMRPMQQPLLPKFIKARLNYASEMLAVTDAPSIREGNRSPVSLQDFIAFARAHVDHQAADVRQAVIEYLIAVYRWFVRIEGRDGGITARQAISDASSSAKRGVIDSLLKGMAAVDSGSDAKQIEYSQGGSKRGSLTNGDVAGAGGKRTSLTNSMKSPRMARNNSYAASTTSDQQQFTSPPPKALQQQQQQQRGPSKKSQNQNDAADGAISPASSVSSRQPVKQQQRSSVVLPPKTRIEDELEDIEETEWAGNSTVTAQKDISAIASKIPKPAAMIYNNQTQQSPVNGRNTGSPYLKEQLRQPNSFPPPMAGNQQPIQSTPVKRNFSPTKPARDVNPEVLSNQWNIDRTCIFCEQTSTEFTDRNLDQHYWNDCPMLTRCLYCQHVVEIASLGDHLITECAKKEDTKRCPRCSLVVSSSKFENHLLEASCELLREGESTCQLCRLKIKDGEIGWRRHLRDPPGCPRSNRKPFTQSPTKSPATMVKSPGSRRVSSAQTRKPTTPQKESNLSPTGSPLQVRSKSGGDLKLKQQQLSSKSQSQSPTSSPSTMNNGAPEESRSPELSTVPPKVKNRSFLSNMFSKIK